MQRAGLLFFALAQHALMPAAIRWIACFLETCARLERSATSQLESLASDGNEQLCTSQCFERKIRFEKTRISRRDCGFFVTEKREQENFRYTTESRSIDRSVVEPPRGVALKRASESKHCRHTDTQTVKLFETVEN